MPETYDVIVIGLGVLGSATTYELARRGKKVLALERYGPVHDVGASHGETRGLLQTYFMGPGYVPLVRRSYELWSRLEDTWGEKLVTTTGGLFLGPADGLLVPTTLASAQAAGLSHESLDAAGIRQRFPEFTPHSTTTALYDPSAGFLNPERALVAFQDLAIRRGARLQFHCPVSDFSADTTGVTVHSGQQEYHAADLVVCAGAWSAELLGPKAFPVQILRKTQLWFSPAGTLADFQAGSFPFWAWEADGAICYGFPAMRGFGRGVKVAFHTGGSACTPDDLDRQIHPEDVDEVRDFLAERIPRLAATFTGGSACMYDVTPDSAFVIGTIPGESHVFVASGSSGHAFKFAPAIGEAIAELVTEGNSRQDLSLFEPGRFTRSRPVSVSKKADVSSMFSLAGKTALVTGASRGIGRAIALGFAEAGADVVILARGADALADLAVEIEKLGRRALVIACDVGEGARIRQAIAESLAEFEYLDIVVNNAGSIEAAGPFVDLPFTDWATTMRVNFESMIHVCQAIGPHLLTRGSGSVINMASVAGVAGVPMLSPYAASKAAIISLTRTLAAEWASSGVRVNALTPGWTATELTRTFSADDQVSADLLRAVPHGGWADPSDVVGSAIFLASDAARLVTGTCLTVDGGLTSYAGGPALLGLLGLGRIPT